VLDVAMKIGVKKYDLQLHCIVSGD